MGRPKKQSTTSVFSVNLRKVLDERQLTLKMAADLMGVPYTTLVEWANGASPSNIEAIGGFCRKMGIDFQWLLTGVHSRTSAVDLPAEDLLREYFEERDDGLSGLFKITATRLVRRKKEAGK
jgi:hypothetical protein